MAAVDVGPTSNRRTVLPMTVGGLCLVAKNGSCCLTIPMLARMCVRLTPTKDHVVCDSQQLGQNRINISLRHEKFCLKAKASDHIVRIAVILAAPSNRPLTIMVSRGEAELVTVKTTLPIVPFPPLEERAAILTERLILRPYRADDVHSLYAIHTDEETMAWTATGKAHTTIEETQKKSTRSSRTRDVKIKILLSALLLREKQLASPAHTGAVVALAGPRSAT